MSLEEKYKAFKGIMEKTELLDFDKAALTIEGEVARVTIPLQEQQLAGDFVKTLRKYITIEKLCNCKLEDGKRYKYIVYSQPYLQTMYIIRMESYQHGLINEVHVIFYESMEHMLKELKDALEQAKRMGYDEGEMQKIVELYRKFM